MTKAVVKLTDVQNITSSWTPRATEHKTKPDTVVLLGTRTCGRAATGGAVDGPRTCRSSSSTSYGGAKDHAEKTRGTTR